MKEYKATKAFKPTKKNRVKKQQEKTKKKSLVEFNTSTISNRRKRMEVVFRKKKETGKIKKKERKERQLENEENPDKKLKPLTTDNKRIDDDNIVHESDSEIQAEEEFDEFKPYFDEKTTPKIFLTTNQRAKGNIYSFLQEIKLTFPHCYYYPRKNYSLNEICKQAVKRDYTDVMCFTEYNRKVDELILIHLPAGPTATFRITSDVEHENISNKASFSDHFPELILNGFNSKIGRKMGRFFSSLIPQKPDFEGRRVITFHNQRDFIFFRHHRYEVNDKNEKVNIQEIGPRFTLKLMKLQQGIFDNVYGEIEYQRKDKMYVDRKKTYL